MVCLDSVLSQIERNQISEIFWACRFGSSLKPLMENNPLYPTLKIQHTLQDEVGIDAWKRIYPHGDDWKFWHFRPDYPTNLQIGSSCFGRTPGDFDLIIDAARIFQDPNRHYTNSSFILNAKENDINWWGPQDIVPYNYILVHYPTSTRPRSDIAQFTLTDWEFVKNLSQKENLPVVVITDTDIQIPLTNSILLKNPPIKEIPVLTKFCKFYVGCDSFVCHLSCKSLDRDHLFVKTHEPNVALKLETNVWIRKYFYPHPWQDVAKFYKSYLG